MWVPTYCIKNSRHLTLSMNDLIGSSRIAQQWKEETRQLRNIHENQYSSLDDNDLLEAHASIHCLFPWIPLCPATATLSAFRIAPHTST